MKGLASRLERQLPRVSPRLAIERGGGIRGFCWNMVMAERLLKHLARRLAGRMVGAGRLILARYGTLGHSRQACCLCFKSLGCYW